MTAGSGWQGIPTALEPFLFRLVSNKPLDPPAIEIALTAARPPSAG
jgi:hypothetical protein